MSNGKTLLTLGDDRERRSGYAQIRFFEGDCDRAQAQIRTAASTWILTGRGGLLSPIPSIAPDSCHLSC